MRLTSISAPQERDEPPEDVPVREVVEGTGRRKLIIYRRASGTFYFEEWAFGDEPLERCWIPLPRRPIGVYDSAEAAFREAAARIPWLRESQTVEEEDLS